MEKQVLFRIDGKLLDSLDKRIARDGYSTRNAWFKDVVAGYAGRGAKAPSRGTRGAKGPRGGAKASSAKRARRSRAR